MLIFADAPQLVTCDYAANFAARSLLFGSQSNLQTKTSVKSTATGGGEEGGVCGGGGESSVPMPMTGDDKQQQQQQQQQQLQQEAIETETALSNKQSQNKSKVLISH